MYVIVLEDEFPLERDELMASLREAGIDTLTEEQIEGIVDQVRAPALACSGRCQQGVFVAHPKPQPGETPGGGGAERHRADDPRGESEIITVDNVSTDGTAEVLHRLGPRY